MAAAVVCCVGCRVAPCFDSYCFGAAMDWGARTVPV